MRIGANGVSSHPVGHQMQLNLTRPRKLYRYGELKWLTSALHLGEFRLRPASDYKSLVNDEARYDDELLRVRKSPGAAVTITMLDSGQQLKPIGDVTYENSVGTNYRTLCFSERWDEHLFDDFENSDACLVIHEVDEFSERLHAAVAAVLPNWAGLDARVSYGVKSEHGAVFSKPLEYITQHEWRFAWLPPSVRVHLEPLSICIGSLEHLAEIVLVSSTAKGSA
jgi:hypothetical protein